MRLVGILALSLAMLSPTWVQQPSARSPHDPVLDQLTAIAQDFERRARLASSAIRSATPVIVVDSPPQLSMLEGLNTIHSSRWEELPPDVQASFTRWATYAGDVRGEQLFDDMFHRFFFVHELAHWLQRQGSDNTTGVYQFELAANRLTVAYWREKEGTYLSALLPRFRRINERLPNPVPSGQNPEQYFNANYRKMGSNPEVYGWFQTRMVLQAASERPIRTFAGALHDLSVHATKPLP